ncbi:MAG TPA: efflux RND transporter periplasmic adaptor subunit [Bryobacteraceae bacterium]|nr:efflux RND transporter periplasmic adaptor subunit [Bryobacteraceae bacterium]
MEPELKSLRIDRAKKRSEEPSPWAVRWIVAGVSLFVLLGAGRFVYGKLTAATEVETVRVHAAAPLTAGEGSVILNATGYIVAAHKIELAAKVVGKVAWIGVDKGYKVKAGQVLVRLEDDEYRARLLEAKGNLDMLKARLAEAEHGSRPEEIAKAKADVEQARADQQDARTTLDRTRELVQERVMAKQALDDAQARYDSAAARVTSLDRGYELVRLGPRKEQIDALRAQVQQAEGTLNYAQVQLDNTVIRAPVDGTILERNVEKGEFVTTGFVGDKGAKGYVVSMADLHDLEVELDINQNDFGKLNSTQPGIITTDAYPDRKYQGVIREISPEANRQKATVQVKVKVVSPDDFLRPEMNASVAFYSTGKSAGSQQEAKPIVIVPSSAVRDGAVFVVVNGKALRRVVKTGGSTSQGLQVSDGLIGGEDLIVNAPAGLKDGQKVRLKKTNG